MGIRTGRQFLDSLRDGREIWVDGERIADVTRDRRFAGAAHTIAELFDLQGSPKLVDKMTYKSPTTGDRVGLSFIEPRSREDLARRREMIKVWMDHTCGMLGRSMDFMNCLMTGMASASKDFDRPEHPFGKYLRAYYEHIRENDLVLTHTLVNPQVDRSRPVEAQTKEVAARIVKETDAGFVIRGARMVTTLCAFSNDLMAAPSVYLNMNEEAKAYAFSFSIPMSTPGLRFICRPSLVVQGAASPMDNPLSTRFDEGDGVVIFDDVLVPWERTFVYRDIEMCNGLFNRTGTMNHMMHQFSTKNLAKAEFMMGLAFALAESTKIDAHLHVQGMLAEMINTTEFVRACLIASEAQATPMNDGVYVPAAQPLWCVRQMFPPMFHRMCELIQIMGAGGIVAAPSYAEIDGPRAQDVEKYFQAANADSKTRIKLFRLAYDAAVSSFSGRQQLYERYYSGDPVRLAGTLYSIYDKKTYKDRIWTMLEELETRAQPGAEDGPGFAPRMVAAE
jgi:4-hydroxyphenylacetate 3-monooxygenase